MPTKIVNLDGSLNTQDDDFDVGFNGFTQLVNLRQENGKLVQRYGSGTATSISSKNIDNMVIFVDRRLQGIKVKNVQTNEVSFSASASTLTIAGTMNTINIDAPGGDATDLTSVFKPGDSVYLSYSDTANNTDEMYVISAVTANVLTFLAPVTDETLNASGESFIISFAYADYNDGAPSGVPTSDANSFDGRAFLSTYSNSGRKYISMLNPLDYTDNTMLEDFGANSDDIVIKPRAYADAVRFSCGLENSPRIFRYVNRHHFNGLFKTVWNENADLLYPRWMIDTAVPTVTANTFTLEEAKLDDNNGEESASAPYYGIRYIRGGLDLLNNEYEWIFVPVYDGVQEGLIKEPLLTINSGDMQVFGSVVTVPDIDWGNIPFESPTWTGETIDIARAVSVLKGSMLTLQTGTMLSTLKINLQTLNPRMSGINVYRRTNNGTPFKVKSIYMGDNDSSQKTITDGYNETDRIWWTGGTDLSGGGGSDGSFIDVDSAIVMNNSEAFTTDNGTGWNNFQSTGCRSVELGANLDGTVNAATNWYSDRAKGTKLAQSHFNKISEGTEIISGGDNAFTGGSIDGGWYFANATEKATGTFNSGAEAGSTGDMANNCGDYDTGKPFNYASTSGADFRFSNPGDEVEAAGCIFDIYDTNDLSGNYIISGWVRAVGLNHRDSRWNFYVHTDETLTDFDAAGTQQIASGLGTNNANMPWVYFQYTLTGLSSNKLFGYVWINTPNGLTSTANDEQMFVQVWGLSLRQEISNYTLSDRLRGFMGHDVMVSASIEDLDVPAGALKGNRIQDDTTVAYPVNVDTDRTYISDNYGQFIRTCGWVPGLVNTDNNKDNFLLSTNNYQFYSNGSDNTNQYVLLDFLDTGLPDGARHPNETATSTDVKFKHSTMLNGRQFVANVKITSEEDIEEYPNFVMYSEVNSPDIIPVGNFIQLQDLQGGEIVGIETLMSDLVVFMTHGIFRINVPSNDPSNWSLVEAHPNIGCLHDKAIAKAPNGIFFLSRSDVIFLDSGFQVTPVSNEIRDTYQAQSYSSPSILRLHYDNKFNLLYLNYSKPSPTIFYLFDITRGVWYQETHAGTSYDEFAFDDNNATILIESDSTSKVRTAYNTSEYRDDAGNTPVAVEFSAKTGKQILSTLDKDTIIRRVNTIVTHNASASDTDLDVITENATVSKNGYLDGTQSTRISNRGKYIQIEINNTGDSAENYEHEINHVDVEYE